MQAVESTVAQKTFGEQLDKVHEGPIKITRYGREAAVIVSPRFFRELLSSYRRALPIEALSPDQVEMMMVGKLEGVDYNLDDLPDFSSDAAPAPGC